MNSTSKYLQYSIIALVFLLLAMPYIVSDGLFFPYITGKAFYFRTIIEIMTALYIILVCYNRSFLPKKSPIAYAMIGFLVVMALATVFSVAPAKSFWSNYERMEGYLMLIHLGLLFLVTSSVMNTRRLWVYLFHTSMAASIIVGLKALQDLSQSTDGAAAAVSIRIQGTLGNSSYLGIYALLHIFLALFFLLSHFARKDIKDMLSRIFGYALVIVFNIVILFQTGTRGALLGLGLGVLLTAGILAFREKQSKKVKYLGVSILAVAVIVIGVLGMLRGSDFAKSHPLVDRYSSLVTWNLSGVLEQQGYSRAGLLWPMAWKGVEERPILGWGQDNFGYVFAKYYNPAAYSQEQWFDRTHNVFFDWLIAGGFLGLISYLALFVALIMTLWSKHPDHGKGHKWPLIERAVISGLLLGYFVHNFFVFDNLTSYLVFFLLLSYFHERNVSANELANPKKAEYAHAPLLPLEGSRLFVSTLAVVALVASLYYVNYKPYKNSHNLILAIQALSNHYDSTGKVVGGSPTESYSYLKGIFDSNTTLGLAEARERLIEISASVVTSTSTSDQVKSDFDGMTRDQYAKQLERFPGDPRYNYFFGLYLSRVGDINGAIEQLQKAEALSPTKQQFITQEALIDYSIKKYDLAVSLLKKSFELEPKNDDARVLYAYVLIYAGKADEAASLVQGTNVESDARLVQAYMDNGKFDVVEALAKKKIAADPNNAQLHISLAALYIKVNRKYDAISELKTAEKIEPQFKTQGDKYIQMIQNGEDPTK